MLNHRIRILSSLLIAFIIVNLYGRLSTGPLISPIQADNIKNLLSNIKFPILNLTKLFTLQLNPSDNNLADKQFNQPNSSVEFSSVSPVPTQPCTGQACLTPTITSPTLPDEVPTEAGLTKIPTKIPTRIPTNKPKPTKPPEPTATPVPPPITSDTRPGTTLAEIFDYISKTRWCVPAALLRAFQEAETGSWFHYSDDPVPFNTYGWWTTAAPDPCKGFGYDTSTGYVPNDSYKAGTFCRVTPGANPGTMGVFAIDQWEQDTTRKYSVLIIPNNFDRRVIFDNALIFAIAEMNRIGNQAPACGVVWPDDVVILAAKKHLCGNTTCTCITQNGYSYCDQVLSLYKKYR